MKVTIKRRTIIKVIRDNQLVAGMWFEPSIFYDPYDKVLKPNCTACLVGKVLIKSANPKTVGALNNLSEVIDANIDAHESVIGFANVAPLLLDIETANRYVDQHYYLSSLSHMFEGTIAPKVERKRLKHVERYGNDDEFLLKKVRRNTKLSNKDVEFMVSWVKKHIPVEFTVGS